MLRLPPAGSRCSPLGACAGAPHPMRPPAHHSLLGACAMRPWAPRLESACAPLQPPTRRSWPGNWRACTGAPYVRLPTAHPLQVPAPWRPCERARGYPAPAGRGCRHSFLPVAGCRHGYRSGNGLAHADLNILNPRVMYLLPSIIVGIS